MKTLSGFINEAIGKTYVGQEYGYTWEEYEDNLKDIMKAAKNIKNNSISADELYEFMMECGNLRSNSHYSEPAKAKVSKMLSKMGVRKEQDIDMLSRALSLLFINGSGLSHGNGFVPCSSCSAIKKLGTNKKVPTKKVLNERTKMGRDERYCLPEPRYINRSTNCIFVPLTKSESDYLCIHDGLAEDFQWLQSILCKAAGINF